ncbi:hypothetical protein [Bacillus paramycoides]
MIERDFQTNPSIEVLTKIASALEVDVQTLLNPDRLSSGETSTGKIHVNNWSNLINTALESGVIDEKDLREISITIQKGKTKQ